MKLVSILIALHLAALALAGPEVWIIYVIGGQSARPHYEQTVEAYNSLTEKWSFVANLSSPRMGPAAAMLEGKIYSIGCSNAFYPQVVDVYDPITNKWSPAPNLTQARAYLAATANGKLYALGGYDGQDYLSSMETFDPAMNTWQIVGRGMSTKRDLLAVAMLADELYAIGGYNNEMLNSVEKYNPVTNIWTPVAPLNTSRYGHSAVVVDGKIYILGGHSTSVEAYDPISNKWSVVSNMPIERYKPGAVVHDGLIYVIGGQAGTFGPFLDTMDIYNPKLNTWTTSAARLSIGRSFSGVTLL